MSCYVSLFLESSGYYSSESSTKTALNIEATVLKTADDVREMQKRLEMPAGGFSLSMSLYNYIVYQNSHARGNHTIGLLF